MAKVPIAETQFLFALRDVDPQNGIARQILEKTKERADFSLKIPPVAFIELISVLFSQSPTRKSKKSRSDTTSRIKQILNVIDKILDECRIGIADFNLDQLISAMSIYNSTSIGLFDSLIAGVADDLKAEVVSDDEDFEVAGLKRLGFIEYLRVLR